MLSSLVSSAIFEHVLPCVFILYYRYLRFKIATSQFQNYQRARVSYLMGRSTSSAKKSSKKNSEFIRFVSGSSILYNLPNRKPSPS